MDQNAESSGFVQNNIDFSRPPTTMEKYEFPQKITRENFTSALIKSFSVSRGNMMHQALFFDFVEAKTGSPFRQIIEEFLAVDGWTKLTNEEQSLFMKYFDLVKAHTQAEDAKKFHEDPAGILDKQLKEVLEYFYVEDWQRDFLKAKAKILEHSGKRSLGELSSEEFSLQLNQR